MSQIEGIEGLGEQVAGIDLPNTPGTDNGTGEETRFSLVTPEGEVDITDVVENASNDFDGDPDPAEDTDTPRVVQLPGANGELFDAGSYQDSGIPVVDGQATDKLVYAFGGSLPFEATDNFAQTLFENLKLGSSVTLQVEALVVKKDGAYKVNAKDEETITGGVRLKVTSLYVKSPEDL